MADTTQGPFSSDYTGNDTAQPPGDEYPESTGMNHVAEELDPTTKTPSSFSQRFRRLVTVEPVMFLYFFAWMPFTPTTQQYVYAEISKQYGLHEQSLNESCHINKTDPYYILEQQVQSKSSQWMIIFNVAMMLPGILSTSILGSYSDKAGRKPAMIMPVLGGIFRAFFSILVVSLQWDFHLMLVGVVIDGACGGVMSIIGSCFAYVADITSHKQRSFRIFVIEIMIGTSIAASQISVGYIIKSYGFVYPFVLSESVLILNLIIVLFYIKETIPKHIDAKILETEHLKKIARLFIKNTETHKRWKIMVLFFLFFLINTVDLGSSDAVTYTQLDSPLCFTSILIGYYVSVVYSLKFTVSTSFMKLFHFKLGDLGCIVVGCFFGICGQIVVIFATNVYIMFLSPVVGCLSALSTPLIRASLSKLGGPNEQGVIFACIGLTQQASIMIGGIAFNAIYSSTVNIYAHAVFFVTAGFYFVAMITAVIMWALVRKEKTTDYDLMHEQTID